MSNSDEFRYGMVWLTTKSRKCGPDWLTESLLVIFSFFLQNYRRVAEVWMDEYKNYLYQRRPHYLNVDTGNISAQLAIREKLKCKPFKWFMQEVAFDLPKKYPMVEPPNVAEGEVLSLMYLLMSSPFVCVCLCLCFPQWIFSFESAILLLHFLSAEFLHHLLLVKSECVQVVD